MPARPRDRKDAIAAAAAELFAAKGFAAVGVDEIAAAVGITGPAVYRHFRGKGALLAAVVERGLAALATSIDAHGSHAVDDVVRASVTFVLDHRAPVAAYLREEQRLRAHRSEGAVAAERRLARIWQAAVEAEAPGLDRDRVTARRNGVIAALAAAAASRHGVERPRLDDVLTAAAGAVAVAPARPAVVEGSGPPGTGGETARWRPPPTRREVLLAAALRLFGERGFNGVGVDEIGAAAGIAGPTVYHYVDAKTDLLVDAFDRTVERVAVGVDQALGAATSAGDALERLARSYAGIATDAADLIAVTAREAGSLPDESRRRVARRARAVRDAWATVVGEVRPDLAEAEVRLLVRTAFPLVNAAAGPPVLVDDVAGLAVAYLRGEK